MKIILRKTSMKFERPIEKGIELVAAATLEGKTIDTQHYFRAVSGFATKCFDISNIENGYLYVEIPCASKTETGCIQFWSVPYSTLSGMTTNQQKNAWVGSIAAEEGEVIPDHSYYRYFDQGIEIPQGAACVGIVVNEIFGNTSSNLKAYNAV